MNKTSAFNQAILFSSMLCLTSITVAESSQNQIAHSAVIPIEESAVYNPSTQSRMRLYGQNGKKIYIQHSFDCEGKKQGIKDYLSSNGGLNAFKTYARLTFNQSKGMPRTAIQKQVEGNTMSTYQLVSYKELILKANDVVNLHGFVMGTEKSTKKAQVIGGCENAVASFKPLAGHDYEVLGHDQNNQCQFQVIDLQLNQQVAVSNQAYACPQKSEKFWKLF